MAKFAKPEYFPMEDTLSLSMLWNNARLQISVRQVSHADVGLLTVYKIWPRFHVTCGNGK